eukprot:9450119-Pyramimonas_sp.AAC.1
MAEPPCASGLLPAYAGNSCWWGLGPSEAGQPQGAAEATVDLPGISSTQLAATSLAIDWAATT